jgi:hypothetical protein
VTETLTKSVPAIAYQVGASKTSVDFKGTSLVFVYRPDRPLK